jgi:hypothetical protein
MLWGHFRRARVGGASGRHGLVLPSTIEGSPPAALCSALRLTAEPEGKPGLNGQARDFASWMNPSWSGRDQVRWLRAAIPRAI